MSKYREVILKDGRKVFIDNKGNIVESGTFQQPTGKQSLASLPVDNNVKPAKVDLLNIDLGDNNKSDGSAVVETPVENAVRTTSATPRRRTASTPIRRTQTSTPAKVVDKRNGSTVTVTAPSKNNPSTLPEVTITSTKSASNSTAVKTKTSTPITSDKGYYKGTRYSKNGNYKFEHDGKGKLKVYIKSHNSSGWNHIYTTKREGSVSEDEMEIITRASQNGYYFTNQYNNKTGKRLRQYNSNTGNTKQTAQNRKQVLTKKTQNNAQQSSKAGNNKSYLNPKQIQEIADRQNTAFNELGLLNYAGAGATKTGTGIMKDTYNAIKRANMARKSGPISKEMHKANIDRYIGDLAYTVGNSIKDIRRGVRNTVLDARQSIMNVSRKVKDTVKNQANRSNTITLDKRAQVIDRANKNNARVQQAQYEYNRNNTVLGKISQYLERKGMSYDRGPASRVKYETKQPQVINNSVISKPANSAPKPTSTKTVNPTPAGRNPKLGQRKRVLGSKNKHNKGKRK